MKLRVLLAGLAGAALLGTAGSAAASTATSDPATASASVTIATPVTVTKVSDMAFGTITRPAGSQTPTITLNPDTGAVTVGAGSALVSGSTTSAAVFTVNGPAGMTFTTNASMGSSDSIKTLTAWTLTPSSSNPTTIGGGGTASLRFGGSFQISSATAAQTYTGTLTVTVSYP